MFRKYIRIIAIFFIVVSFLIISVIADILISNRRRKLLFFSKNASFYTRLLLGAFGVRVKYRNIDNLTRGDKNFLIVSNHLSYIDVFIIFSLVPSVFVANSELNDQFLLGSLTGYAGGIFVERRNRTKLSEEIDLISDLLDDGFNVVLFPEGTTSNGDGVLPFKNPFITAAMRSVVDIVPVCVKYRRIDGEDISSTNRDDVYYYGDATFFDHALRLISHKAVEAEMFELEKIEVKPGRTRKELSNLAYSIISSAYLSG
jgi:1-acyl-sn-glycerol-3-phosphate acyltransferase